MVIKSVHRIVLAANLQGEFMVEQLGKLCPGECLDID